MAPTNAYDHRGGGPYQHGPLPAMVYICESEASRERAEHLAAHCRAFARACAWVVVGTVLESTPLVPLDQRDGWRQVRAALADGSVHIVVIQEPASVCAGLEEFESLRAAFRADGAVLVAVSGVPEPPAPRHRPAA